MQKQIMRAIISRREREIIHEFRIAKEASKNLFNSNIISESTTN